MNNTFISLFVCLNALVCSTLGSAPESNPEAYHLKDLTIIHGSTLIKGFGVLPAADSYTLTLESRKEAELVRVSNCHRDVVFRDIDDERFVYTYTPNGLIENGSCLLQFTFLDEKGFHQFGAISFIGDETLPAVLSCNGALIEYRGASVCQRKSGTLHVAEFAEQVEVTSSKSCEAPTSENGRIWQYSIKKGFCLFLFKNERGEFHKLTTFGYNDFMKQ